MRTRTIAHEVPSQFFVARFFVALLQSVPAWPPADRFLAEDWARKMCYDDAA